MTRPCRFRLLVRRGHFDPIRPGPVGGDQAGYVEWDRETGKIDKGNRFAGIAPLIEFIGPRGGAAIGSAVPP